MLNNLNTVAIHPAWIIVFNVVIAFQQLINAIFFWVNTPFLKSLCFSLLIINILQYCNVLQFKTQSYIIQGLYLLYTILAFLLPYYDRGFEIMWYEWIMLIPFLIVIFFGVYIKFTAWGQKWLNYYMINVYYACISILITALLPELGTWWACLIYVIILLLFANVGGMWQNDSL